MKVSIKHITEVAQIRQVAQKARTVPNSSCAGVLGATLADRGFVCCRHECLRFLFIINFRCRFLS